MAEKNSEQSFFNDKPLLKVKKTNTEIKHNIGNLQNLLTEFNMNGKIVAHCMNELKFGYYDGEQFKFSDDSQLDEKYILQLRIFNPEEELLLQRNDDNFTARYIKDSENKKGNQEYIDSDSPLFGNRDTTAHLPQGFIRLIGNGRKISMIIPTDKIAKNYQLTTRSYIEYDKDTGQAGYGFWRFVAIDSKI